MEDTQSTELATAEGVIPTTPAPEASAPTQEVKTEIVSPEPRHPLQDILDKAAEKAKAKEALSTEKKPEATSVTPPAPVFDHSKWDGNVLTLPENIRKIVDDNKTAFHEKAKEAATFKGQLDTLQKQVNDYIEQTEQKPLFSEEEFQAAQLDSNKFLELSQRVARDIVSKEKAQLEPIISQIQFDKKVAENEKLVNDFAFKNKDFWNMYDTGILEPFISKLGLEDGYKKASEIFGKIHNEELMKSQNRVLEKKSSVSATPTQSGTVQVVYVNNPNDVLSTAAQYAAEGKKVKVRYKPD